jgi:hypothetical protein
MHCILTAFSRENPTLLCEINPQANDFKPVYCWQSEGLVIAARSKLCTMGSFFERMDVIQRVYIECHYMK